MKNGSNVIITNCVTKIKYIIYKFKIATSPVFQRGKHLLDGIISLSIKYHCYHCLWTTINFSRFLNSPFFLKWVDSVRPMYEMINYIDSAFR
jgi:hypothetical protein